MKPIDAVSLSNYNNIITLLPGLSRTSETDIPCLFLIGNIGNATKDVSVTVDFDYVSRTDAFKGALSLKWQGTSSLIYPKKNYTIKLYTDATKQNELKKNFFNWGEQSKFCLKANYIDHSHARNVVSAKIWSKIVASRSAIPEELEAAPNYGAIDGFPIKLFLNGSFIGLYTWNIPKDGWLLNLSDATKHAAFCAEVQDYSCAFLGPAVLDGSDWSLIYPNTVSTSIFDSFSAMVNHVKDMEGESFKSDFTNFLDLEACIDYYCYSLIMCHLDGLAKNMIMATYDGITWIPSMYDMDSTWGLYYDGASFVSPYYLFVNEYQSPWSKLWDKLKINFKQEIYDRYQILRNGPLSTASIMTEFMKFEDWIPEKLFSQDIAINTGIPNKEIDHYSQITSYINLRLNYSDVIIEALVHRNRYNPKNSVQDYFLESTSGNKVIDTEYVTSGPIAVEEGSWFLMGHNQYYCRAIYYDKNDNFIQGFEGGINYEPLLSFSPVGARVVRISHKKLDTEIIFEKGDMYTGYVPYGQ